MSSQRRDTISEGLACRPYWSTSKRATKGFEDYQFSIWIGVVASAKTPNVQMAAVHKATYTALNNPEIRKIIETAGSTVAEPMTLAQLDAFYKKETVTATAIAKSIKLEPL
jgi:tripartite-type tricarboxylate transporter receptor subunit TctC